MPKIKTKSSAKKRFKVSGNGKFIRNKAYRRHILTKKSAKRKRRLRQHPVVDETNVKALKRLLPYL